MPKVCHRRGTECGRGSPQAVANPNATMFVRNTGIGIIAAQKRPPHATLNRVHVLNLVRILRELAEAWGTPSKTTRDTPLAAKYTETH